VLHSGNTRLALYSAAALFATAVAAVYADDSNDLRKQVEQLQRENAELKEQLNEQRTLIDGLARKVQGIEQTTGSPEPDSSNEAMPSPPAGFSLGKVHIGGEGGIGFFDTGDNGMFPNSEFRVDEAKLFIEAPIWNDVYFFSELNFAQREYEDLDVDVGELYLDFENVSKLWGHDRALNVRIGRMDIPFGEEYITRDVFDNPLISRSLMDFWGVDEGVELYGAIGRFSYVAAVQNGGVSVTRDFHCDKSVAGRVGYDPARWLHLSVSAMRTGALDAEDDFLSELWFGNGWFRSIGSSETTQFHANLVEGDVHLRFSRGDLKAFGGYVCYDDNDPNGDNQRDIYFYSIEGVLKLTRKFYAAARFGQIFVKDGYPIAGNGNQGDYFFTFDPNAYAEELWRLSLGLGYRFSENLAVKAEYSFEEGKEVSGARREDVDFVGAEAVFRF
jgi:hypothetical protein